MGSWGEVLRACKAAFPGIVGLAGFEDAIDLMEKLAHDGDDDLFGFLAVLQEPVGEGFEQWVEDAGGHGGHEKTAPEVHRADLGDGRADPARGAAGVVLWRAWFSDGRYPG